MILAHIELSRPITLCECHPTILVIEHQRHFREWVQMLSFQCGGDEGDFVLSHDGDDRSFQKHVQLIRDPLFDTEIESHVSKALLSSLERRARDEYIAETRHVEETLLQYAETLCQGLSITLESTDSIDVKSLIKLLRIAPEWEESLLSRLSAQMRLAQEYLHAQLFIFVGLKSYLSDEELVELYREFSAHQLHLLLIEPYQHTILPEESTVIIDHDLCELRFPPTEKSLP